jgi:hypothetical protein
VENLVLTLYAGFPVSGRLRIEGQAQEKGKGLTGIVVALAPESEDDHEAGGESSEVQEDGSFTLQSVFPGAYRVWVHSSVSGGYIKEARLAGRDVLRDGVNLAGGNPGRLEMVLGTDAGRIDGLVLNEESLPAHGATVFLRCISRRGDAACQLRHTSADQNGHFVLEGVPPGKYEVYAIEEEEPPAWNDRQFFERNERRAATVEVVSRGRHSVELRLIPDR